MRGNPSPNPNHFCQALYVDTDRDNKLSYNYLLLGGHSVIMAWFPQESGLRSGVFFRTYPSTSKMFSLKKWTNKQKINVGRIFLFLEQFSPSGSYYFGLSNHWLASKIQKTIRSSWNCIWNHTRKHRIFLYLLQWVECLMTIESLQSTQCFGIHEKSLFVMFLCYSL